MIVRMTSYAYLRRAVLLVTLLLLGCSSYPTEEQEIARDMWSPGPALPEPFNPAEIYFGRSTVAQWLHWLRHGNDRQRRQAAGHMWNIYAGDKATSYHSLWRSPPSDIKERMLLAVREGRISDGARVLVPALVHALRDQNPRVRRAAARSLLLIGPEAAAAIGELRSMSHDDPDPEVREMARDALGEIQL